jgi:hypothetical protein
MSEIRLIRGQDENQGMEMKAAYCRIYAELYGA